MINVFHINCNYITTALHQTMIEHLNKYNCYNTVCVPVCKQDISDAVIKPADYVNVINCFNKRDRYLFQYKQSKIFKAVKPVFENGHYDIIHAYTLFSDGNCAMNLSKMFGVPYVVAIRDTDVNAFFKYMLHLRKLGLEIMIKAKAIFFLSSSYKDYVLANYVPDKFKDEIESKSYIQPNGIDDYWFNSISEPKSYNPSKKCVNVVFVGKLIKRKNPLITVQALKILKEQGYNVHFTVIGRNEDTRIYKSLISCDFVDYITQQPKEIIREYYKKNDIFVMPSLTETFGLTYAEAMSQGLPVLYSRGQGFDGQFGEGVVGYHINPHDPMDIAIKILMVYKNFDAMSNNCIKLVRKFDWTQITKQYCYIYNRCI